MNAYISQQLQQHQRQRQIQIIREQNSMEPNSLPNMQTTSGNVGGSTQQTIKQNKSHQSGMTQTSAAQSTAYHHNAQVRIFQEETDGSSLNDSILRNNLTLNPSAEEFNGITTSFIEAWPQLGAPSPNPEGLSVKEDCLLSQTQQLFPLTQPHTSSATPFEQSQSRKQSYSFHQSSQNNQIPFVVTTPKDEKVFPFPGTERTDIAAYGTNQSMPVKYIRENISSSNNSSKEMFNAQLVSSQTTKGTHLKHFMKKSYAFNDNDQFITTLQKKSDPQIQNFEQMNACVRPATRNVQSFEYNALNDLTSSYITKVAAPITKSEERNVLLIQREMGETDESICVDDEESGLPTKLPESRLTIQSEEIFQQKPSNVNNKVLRLGAASLQKQQRTEIQSKNNQMYAHFNLTSEFQINNQEAAKEIKNYQKGTIRNDEIVTPMRLPVSEAPYQLYGQHAVQQTATPEATADKMNVRLGSFQALSREVTNLNGASISEWQKRELDQLRQQMEPCELLPPPESTEKSEELMCEPVSHHKRSVSMTAYTPSLPTASKFGSGDRRVTADFQNKPEISLAYKTEKINERLPLLDLPDPKSDEVQSELVTMETIMKNMFYLNSEHPSRKVYHNNVGKVIHKSMNYMCVDGRGPNKSVQIDFIDFIEKQNCQNYRGPPPSAQVSQVNLEKVNDASSPRNVMKQRSLVYFKIAPQGDKDGEADKVEANSQAMLEAETEEIRRVAEIQGFYNFEQLYNQVTEKLITRVIDNEQVRQDQVAHEEDVTQNAPPQTFLLIGEDDTNLIQPLADRLRGAREHAKASQKSTRNTSAIHERLYQESQTGRQRRNQLRKDAITELKVKEEKECTFHPNTMRISPSRKLSNSKNTSSFFQESLLKSTNSISFLKSFKHSFRSPRNFYQDMMTFKERKEAKLAKTRNQDLLEIKQKAQRVFSADQKERHLVSQTVEQQNLLFDKLSKERLQKFKEGDALHGTIGSDGDYYSNNNVSTTRVPMTQRQQSQLLHGLYNDHFDRQNKLKDMQKQELHRFKSATIDLSRSKIILANRIANQTFLAYNEICQKQPRKESLIDKLFFFQLLSKLGYITSGHDAREKALSDEAWSMLAKTERMQLQNLITFLLAVENIFVEQMAFYPEPPAIKADKQFGFTLNSVYYLQSEEDVVAVSRYYSVFNKNRQLMNEQLRLEQILIQKEKNSSKFQPELNQKSLDLAAKNRMAQLQEMQKQHNEAYPLSHRQPQIEDLLIQKGKQAREKVMKHRAELVNSEIQSCTFSPRVCSPQGSSKSSGVLGANRKLRTEATYKRLHGNYRSTIQERERKRVDKKIETEKSAMAGVTFQPNLDKTRRKNTRIRHANELIESNHSPVPKSHSNSYSRSHQIRQKKQVMNVRKIIIEKENVDQQVVVPTSTMAPFQELKTTDTNKGSETHRQAIGSKRSKLLNSFLTTNSLPTNKPVQSTDRQSRRNSLSYINPAAAKKQEYFAQKYPDTFQSGNSSSALNQKSKVTSAHYDREFRIDDSSSLEKLHLNHSVNKELFGLSPLNSDTSVGVNKQSMIQRGNANATEDNISDRQALIDIENDPVNWIQQNKLDSVSFSQYEACQDSRLASTQNQ